MRSPCPLSWILAHVNSGALSMGKTSSPVEDASRSHRRRAHEWFERASGHGDEDIHNLVGGR